MAQSAAPVAAGCEGLKRFIAHAVTRFLRCVYRVRSKESRWIHRATHLLMPIDLAVGEIVIGDGPWIL
jgi:hypothetical protein